MPVKILPIMNLVASEMLVRALAIVYLFDNLRYNTLLDTIEIMHFQSSQLAGTVDFDQSAQQSRLFKVNSVLPLTDL